MKLQLNHKHALVCGGSKGLGNASAVELAKIGARVTLVARSESLLKEAVIELKNISNLEHGYLVLDFSDTNSVRTKISELQERDPIQIVVNNTGGPAGGFLLGANTEDLEAAFRNHILTSQTIAQIVIPGMQRLNYGRIINIVSTSVRQPIGGIGISNTIRGAMASWSKTLSNELAADGITVNNVLPGSTKTERLDEIIQSKMKLNGISLEDSKKSFLNEIPMKRFGQKEEIGSAVAFLASPAAAYITGISLPVDGGKIKSI